MNKLIQTYVMPFMAFISLSLMVQTSIAQPENRDDLYLYDKVSEISDDNIFKTEDYYNWALLY